MSKIVILNRKKLQLYTVLAVVVVLAGAYVGWKQSQAAVAPVADTTQVIQLVTGEFTAKLDNGKQLEAYRWDPGTVYVRKGEPVELRITGINGQSHPFVIEGLDIKGEVNKGKTTVVRFTPKEAGTYPIICTTHADPSQGVPMVGYLVVQ